jgi:hypothetical protein
MRNLSRNQKITVALSLSSILLTLIIAVTTVYFSYFRVIKGLVAVVNNIDRQSEYIDINISLSNPGSKTRVIAVSQVIGWLGDLNGKTNQSGEWNFWVVSPQSFSPSLPVALNPEGIQPMSIRVPFSPPSFLQLEQGITPPEYTLVSGSMSEAHPELFQFERYPNFSRSCEHGQKLFYLALNILSLDSNGLSTYSRLPLATLCISLDSTTSNSNTIKYTIVTFFNNDSIDLLSNPYNIGYFP